MIVVENDIKKQSDTLEKPKSADNYNENNLKGTSNELNLLTNEDAINYLNQENETVVFGFKVEDSLQIVSLCIENNGQYLVFKFGTQENIGIYFPNNSEDSWNSFYYSHYLRGGGEANEALDLNSLYFEDEANTYTIFDDYDFSEPTSRMCGITIKNKINDLETIYIAEENSIIGSLTYFIDNDKIQNQ